MQHTDPGSGTVAPLVQKPGGIDLAAIPAHAANYIKVFRHITSKEAGDITTQGLLPQPNIYLADISHEDRQNFQIGQDIHRNDLVQSDVDKCLVCNYQMPGAYASTRLGGGAPTFQHELVCIKCSCDPSGITPEAPCPAAGGSIANECYCSPGFHWEMGDIEGGMYPHCADGDATRVR